VSAMTTVSAVVFIYSAENVLASISILRLDDNGRTAPAAAFGVTIVATSATLRLIQAVLMRGLLRRTQAWRRR
jgi:iron(III) transport system permease protein